MNYLGIEIGGTKLQACMGDGEGKLQHITRVLADGAGGRSRLCQHILGLVDACLKEAQRKPTGIDRVGIGFGGPVDPVRGVVQKSHQVEGWDDFPLIEWFQQSTGLDAVLGNDSDLAGLAEATFGAGRGSNRVVYMNIGSGIGGAIILDGRLYVSQGAGASEIGHQRIQPAAPGQPWRTLEDVASGWALARQARNLAEVDAHCMLVELVAGDVGSITVETLVEAVRRGDEPARKLWKSAVEWWSVGVANVITLLRPERFVIGGGVALAGDTLFEPLREGVRQQVFQPFVDSYEIVPAALGEEVVLHGAIQWAKQATTLQNHIPTGATP